MPASALAPHKVESRYPCRSSATTDYPDERAVERLYRQRQGLSGPRRAADDLLLGAFSSGLDGSEAGDGTGSMRLVVMPAVSDVSHPAGACQAEALRAAATDRQTPRLANASLVRAPTALSDWNPDGADGWFATNRGDGMDRVGPKDYRQALISAKLTSHIPRLP